MTFYVEVDYCEMHGARPATAEDITDEMVERGAHVLADLANGRRGCYARKEADGLIPCATTCQCETEARAVLTAALDTKDGDG